MKKCLLLLTLITVGKGSTALNASALVVASVVNQAGKYTYSYSAQSNSEGQTITALIIDGIASFDPSSVVSPAGWYITAPVEPPALVWIAIDPLMYATFTKRISGFMFDSKSLPGEGSFTAVFGELDPAGNFVEDGITSVPVTNDIPEPTTRILLSSGVVLMLLLGLVKSLGRLSG